MILVVRTIRLIRPDVHSSCPDERVFTTSTWHNTGRHLSSVRIVNPVGLNRILPAPQPIFSLILVRFCRLVHCLCAFYA
jgi:hypothetical protein